MKLTTMQQAHRMRREWPGFRVVRRDRDFVCWEGEVRPYCKIYTVGIAFWLMEPNLVKMPNPLVCVLDPILRHRVGDPGDPIPHVYSNPKNRFLPFLCLFHPPTDNFDPRKSQVARTIVPWTIEWLACYEGWLATGTWWGGGVAHD